MKTAKLIKLPAVLLEYLNKEFDIHYAHFLKNADYPVSLSTEEKEFFEELEEVVMLFKRANSFNPDLKVIYEDFAEIASRFVDLNLNIISFDEYKRMLENKSTSADLWSYASNVEKQIKNFLLKFDLIYKYNLKGFFGKPKPWYFDKNQCNSKPIELKNTHFKDLLYLKNYDLDSLGYTLSFNTLKSDGEEGVCKFIPERKHFIIELGMSLEDLIKAPISVYEEMREIIEHELTHLVQHLMIDLTKIEEWGSGSRKFKNNDRKNKEWIDLNIEYKAQARDMFNRVKKLNIDTSSLSTMEKGIQDNIQFFRFLKHLYATNIKKYNYVVREIYKDFK